MKIVELSACTGYLLTHQELNPSAISDVSRGLHLDNTLKFPRTSVNLY